MISDEVRAHYVAVLGEPARSATFRVDAYAAEVLKWDAAANTHGVALYCSIGASRDPLRGLGLTHRIELFVGFQPPCDDAARVLAMVALDPVIHGSALGHGQTFTYPEPLWSGTEMRTFLVLEPRVEIIPELALPGRVHVRFLQLIPLFGSELELKVQQGEASLMTEFERAAVPFWDPYRPPLIRTT